MPAIWGLTALSGGFKIIWRKGTTPVIKLETPGHKCLIRPCWLFSYSSKTLWRALSILGKLKCIYDTWWWYKFITKYVKYFFFLLPIRIMLFNRRVLTPVVVSFLSSSAPLSVLCVFLLLLLLFLLFWLYCRVVKNKAQGSELTQQSLQSGLLDIFGKCEEQHKFWSFNYILIILINFFALTKKQVSLVRPN